jgi:hypothetical protein
VKPTYIVRSIATHVQAFYSHITTDPDTSIPTSIDDFVHPENYFEHPELIFEDDEWSAGVEGDYETLALVGDREALSNESSVTLSSTKTSKRTFDEVEEDVREESPASSPGPFSPLHNICHTNI